MLTFIDAWRQREFLQVFTIYLRYLIGGAFIIAAIGMGKLNGSSNLLNSMSTPIQDLEPIQQFFRVMSESGLYWKFIGWTQIVAGVLLMSQRFAKLGALMFFGMILNIFVITISYEFKGTPIVTSLMLLATTYLLVWDVRSFLFLIQDDVHVKHTSYTVLDKPYWVWLSFIMMSSIVLLAILKVNFIIQLLVPFGEGLIAFVLFFITRQREVKTAP
jgi:uncharacterized membrane protein YphA (DoxX/SURF4 family)